jgi:hypothetical protein
MGKGSSGGNGKSEVRDMQVLDSRQDARADARAASGAVSAFAALGVLASAGHVQEARACNREGGDGSACVARPHIRFAVIPPGYLKPMEAKKK